MVPSNNICVYCGQPETKHFPTCPAMSVCAICEDAGGKWQDGDWAECKCQKPPLPKWEDEPTDYSI